MMILFVAVVEVIVYVVLKDKSCFGWCLRHHYHENHLRNFPIHVDNHHHHQLAMLSVSMLA